ncbi:MAG TPA: type II toxin-antitoxin system prevent-host-death family antitoxin [Pseudomonadales bacterium]
MEKATISQLKNSLSAYLKKVRGGQSVLILDRNEPIAVLERVNSNERPEGRLARLEQAGSIRRSRTARPLDALATTKPPKSKKSVLTALLDERREAR